MEQHPIPQDVTGFQFKLIGAMTVKQFGYVSLGAILAVISWYAPVQGFFWNFVAKGICVPIFGLSGIIVAFVPIEGRPVDIMAVNFFHALVAPNQYIYIKKGRKFSFTQITLAKITPATATEQKKVPESSYDAQKEQQLRALLSRSYKDAKSSIDKKEVQFLQSITSIPAPQAQSLDQPAQTNPLPAHFPSSISAPAKTPFSQAQHPKIQPEIQKTISQAGIFSPKILNLEKETQALNSQKDLTQTELLKLKAQMSAPQPTASLATIQQPPDITQSPTTYAHNVPQNMTKNAGFSHIPDSPNIIVGIVKDARANMLPNILVEIKDKDGSPVRAFKTNPLGQFASATPLTDGDYTIELEDPKKLHAFDAVKINASGQIMLPIEIISHDAREELRKALFTN